MSKSKDVKITRSEFIELIYGQVGEIFCDMLKWHEKDAANAQFVNLNEQNAACRLMGIDITARNQDNTGNGSQTPSEDTNRISAIRRELTENIIGLFYDVLVEDLVEVPEGKCSDVLKVPDSIKEFYTMKKMERPIDPESLLSKCRYLLRLYKYNGPSDFAADTQTLWYHMEALGIVPQYRYRNGSSVPLEDSEKVHLPDDRGEMIEAFTKGIPEKCGSNPKTKKAYAEMKPPFARFLFVYPDLARIICIMYLFRNESVHMANWTKKSIATKYQAVDNIILTGMIVTMKNVWPLTREIYKRNDDALIGAEKYCQSIVDSYRDSREDKLCCDFKWKLYDRNPDYVRNLNITPRDSIKKISLSLWSEGQSKANLLTGKAGCGKTWAMRRLQYSYAADYLGFSKDNNNPGETEEVFCPLIPVYIPMVDYYKEMTDLDSIIGVICDIIKNKAAFDEKTREKIPEGVRILLKKGRFLIIFDGVDECPYEDKIDIYRAIEKFVNSITGGKSANLCMISDREVSDKNQAEMILYVADTIDDDDLDAYVERYLKYTRKDLVDEEGNLNENEKNSFLDNLKAMKPSSEIKTAFELAKLAEICSDDEKYQEYLSNPGFLDVIYLRTLIDRESKEKLSAEGGSSEKHMDSIRSILVNLSEMFCDEGISSIDKDSLDKDIMTVTGVDKDLAQAYRKHLVQAGILLEYQDKIDLKLYYRFASEDICVAAGLL